ncbi:MAG: zinc metalloprotease HtpX [Gammaproteobacteria bacterium]|nr:zinc metalloprotease HtpX [Gammaproteobacteria bacterium]
MLNLLIEMNPDRVTAHKLNNLLQSIMLLAGMAALLGLLGWLLAGIKGVIWAGIIGVVFLLVSPRASPRLVFKLSGARPLSMAEAPGLYALVKTLALRARLPTLPQLYYVPTQAMNAFTVGNRRQAMIAITDGLLRGLTRRELTGVLAHEVSHVDNNDMWVMTLADTVNRLTSSFSLFGQVLLFINLPLILLGKSGFSWLAILILVFAPTLSVLLQLALSRTREFDADLGAAQITHDPLGLASALKKLHHYHSGSLRRALVPGRPIPNSSMLRTHPKSEERIRRLVSLAERQPGATESFLPIDEDLVAFAPRLSLGPRLPQWFMGWHGH